MRSRILIEKTCLEQAQHLKSVREKAAKTDIGNHIELRPVRIEDAAALQRLNKEVLGYDCSLTDTKRQLTRLLSMAQHYLVAAVIDDEIIGCIHAQEYNILYSPPMKDILELAVYPAFQHQGIGSRLLAEVERWAEQSDACRIRLVSGEQRIEAHAFYEHNGYVRDKRQINFKKTIRDDT